VLFEVLQHVGIIPGPKSEAAQESEDLKNVALALQGIKNNLIDFMNLVK
jgi:hypothetical protein